MYYVLHTILQFITEGGKQKERTKTKQKRKQKKKKKKKQLTVFYLSMPLKY